MEKNYKEIFKIYPQAKPYKSFGLNFDKDVEVSVGTLFKKNGLFLYTTISPLDFDSVEYLEDEDIILLHSNLGISLRIYHVDYKTITQDVWNALDFDGGIKGGTVICKSGKYYQDDKNFLTYSELYASCRDSILYRIFPEYYQDYSDEFLESLYNANNLKYENISKLKKKESISSINPFCIQKFDTLLNKITAFFSYQALLNL